MKKYVFVCFLSAALLAGGTGWAQENKEKEKEKIGEYDEIIIKKKGDKDGKVTIEIKDGEVKVNGKSIDEFDDDNISVRRRKMPRVNLSTTGSRFRSMAPAIGPEGSWHFNEEGDGPAIAYLNSNKAFLGVSTENGEGGAKIINVTENSGAQKAGLKKGDVITMVDDKKIENPSDLTKAIGKQKPEDKIAITYKREGKINKTTATLGKNKMSSISRSYGLTAPGQFYGPEAMEPFEGFDFNWKSDDYNHLFGTIGGRPRLGIKAQDTEDGKGVKVLEVADESLADKAGIKEGDIITEFDGKAINSADELMEVAQESREKTSVKLQILRDGKSQSIEIKTPKKLKTANL